SLGDAVADWTYPISFNERYGLVPLRRDGKEVAMPDITELGGMEHDIVANALRALYHDTGIRSQDVNLYWNEKRVRARGQLALANTVRKLPTDQETLHVFADLDPLANWGHAARHLFFSPSSGSLLHSE